MNDLIEEQFRRSLANAAGEIDPEPACRRLAARDYRPRVLPRLPLITAGATTAMAAVGAGLVIGLGSSASPAFAGWTATPTSPTGGETATAESRCMASYEARPIRARAYILRESTAQVEADVWHTATVDTRGPYTTLVFEDANGGHFSCTTGPSEDETISGLALPTASSPTPANAFTTEAIGDDWSIPHKEYMSKVEGHVGPGVTAMTFVLTNGTEVEATVAGGWFLAWWPSSLHGTTPGRPITEPSGSVGTTPEHEITSVTLTTSEGTTSIPGPIDIGTRSATQ